MVEFKFLVDNDEMASAAKELGAAIADLVTAMSTAKATCDQIEALTGTGAIAAGVTPIFTEITKIGQELANTWDPQQKNIELWINAAGEQMATDFAAAARGEVHV